MDLPFKHDATIGWFAKNLKTWRLGGWLFIQKSRPLTLDMPCYQQGWNGRDLSPEEQDVLDDRIRQNGFRPFFEWAQLDMIVENLRTQKNEYTDTDLLKAIQHYWDNDSYIDL